MGLFNFLKTKQDQNESASEYKLRKFKCDIEKLQVIIDLVKIPLDERNENWKKDLLENIDTAGFSESIPQIKIGPDGFPYFILKCSENHNPFESYCIRMIKDDILLERGMGIVLNPGSGHSSDWVFSYGDILNYHLNNEFYSKRVMELGGKRMMESNAEVMISQPSESFLPEKAKQQIRAQLIKSGNAKPKMLMMSRHSGGEMIQELVFNIFLEDFSGDSEFEHLMNKLLWYLPRQYIVTTVPKKSEIAKHLKAL